MLFVLVLLSLLPFLFLFSYNDLTGGVLYSFANIAGIIGATLLLWQFLLGVRSVSTLFNKNYTKISKTHQTLGKYGIIFVLLHPYLQTYSYGLSLLTSFSIDTEFFLHVTYGKFAYYLYLIIWVTSALLRKKMRYRPWLYIHYLTYPILALVIIHASEIGTFINSVWWIRLYWNTFTLVFILICALRVANYLNISKKKAYFLRSILLNNDSSEYIFELKESIPVQPGQYFYVRTSFFGESHPYSVLKIQNKKISFGIKKIGKHSTSFDTLKKGATVYLEGPYGVFSQSVHNNTSKKVIFAAGIGVTPFYELVMRFPDNTIMFYSFKSQKDAIEKDLFKDKLGDNFVDIVTQGKGTYTRRIDKEIITAHVPKEYREDALFLICGSKPFMDSVTTILLELGVDSGRIEKEEFTL